MNLKLQEKTDFSIRPTGGVFYVVIDSAHSVQVHYGPTNNCQIFSIASFQNLISFDNNTINIIDKINEVREICQIPKNLCMVDINEHYYNIIKNDISIHAEMRYENLTGSKMVWLLIKL